MRATIVLFMALMLSAPLSFAGDVQNRLESAADVLNAVLGVPEGIPRDLLNDSRCVVVIPSTKKFAFGVGGSYGRGAMVCRSGNDYTGPWGAPVMIALEGGSFGLQIGGQANDYVLLIMNADGVNSLLKSKMKLGADASVAAGPVGRVATAETNVLMRTKILSYSRSRGVFAGVSLEGSTLRPDASGDRSLYGREITARQIVEGAVTVPDSGRRLVSELESASPRLSAG